MPTPLRNRLIVEGDDDKRVLPQLLEQFGIPWGGPKERYNWPAEIETPGGDTKMLQAGYLSLQWKRSGVVNLGVILDADEDSNSRWRKLHNIVAEFIPSLPGDLPDDGFVYEYEDDGMRKRFGAWIMPDNRTRGMLETFLHCCVPNQTSTLWPFIEKHCDDARVLHAAPYKEVHRDKALIHAWLALQDPPGQQLHSAIMQKILVPDSKVAATFKEWFRRLFLV